MTKVQSVVHVHEDIASTIGVGKGHLCVEIRLDVGRTGGFVLQESRVDEVTAADERHVPQTSGMRKKSKMNFFFLIR